MVAQSQLDHLRDRGSRPWSLADSYAHCRQITWSHYENFPVASWMLPEATRRHVAALYAFARAADDFADEHNDPEKSLSLLDGWEKNLRLCYEGKAQFPTFVALAATAKEFDLPMQLFLDLLNAFRRDVRVKRYETFDEVLGYCRRSANPVGRLVLRLFGHRDEQWFAWSDAICTALQLTNFWQDIAVDRAKGRIYIPQEDMRRFGYGEGDLAAQKRSKAFMDLMAFQIARTEKLFDKGKPLLQCTRGRLRAELILIWLGGRRILEKIRAVDCDVFGRRPTLGLRDKAGMLGGLLMRLAGAGR